MTRGVESREGLLCDKHVMAASKILADDFPQLHGLQSTLLYQTDGFSPISIQPSVGSRTEGNEASHTHLSTAVSEKDNQSLFLDEVSTRKSLNKGPPKAIVTPIIGGVIHTRSHAANTPQPTCTFKIQSVNEASDVNTIPDDNIGKKGYGGVEKWKTVLESKDRILAQKNHLIERQKQSITSLQMQLRENESRYLALMNEIHKIYISPRTEVPKANLIVLGDCEKRLLNIHKETDGVHETAYNCATVLQEHFTVEHQVDDFSPNCRTLTEAPELKVKELGSDSTLLEKFKKECHSLENKITTIQMENVKLILEYKKLQRFYLESEARCRRELQAMRERHKQRFVEATAELRMRHKAMAKRVKALEIQLSRNTDIVSALNNELQISHGAIGHLKVSMKELLTQNHQLMEQLSLQESTFKEHTSCPTADERMQQLTVELVHCVEDLESLVIFSSSLLDGSPSPVLNVQSNQDTADVEASSDVILECSIGDKLIQVKKLKEKIDQLRELVSDQFASQVSNACHVQ